MPVCGGRCQSISNPHAAAICPVPNSQSVFFELYTA